MNNYTKEEVREALQIVASASSRCEKIKPKFAEGSAQHSLLKNRIKALAIAQSLIKEERVTEKYTIEELTAALRPVASIISKCTAEVRGGQLLSHTLPKNDQRDGDFSILDHG